MNLIKKIQPYEFLIRWDINGLISGYHLKTLNVIVDDDSGVVESSTDSGAMNAKAAEAVGFPLNAIVDRVATDAIAFRDSAVADKDAEVKAHEATKAEVSNLQSMNATLVAENKNVVDAHNALEAENAELKKQLEAYND